jgi:anti-anti-sigma factor
MATQSVCEFDCELDPKTRVLVISLSGKLDPLAAERLTPWVEEAYHTGVRRFVFDLSRLDYVGSMGLRLFVATHNKVKGEGAVALCAPAAPILEVMEMTKINRILRHYPSRHEAVDATRV